MVALSDEPIKISDVAKTIRIDPKSMNLDSELAVDADLHIYVVSEKWMFGTAKFFYPLSLHSNASELGEAIKSFYFEVGPNRVRTAIATDIQVLEHPDHWEVTANFVNVSMVNPFAC